MSLKDISERAGLHPSTAHRILNDLATGRFVDRTQPGSYRLGMRLLELGNLVKGRLNVRDAAVAPMRELHKLTQQPVNLSVRETKLSMWNAPLVSALECRLSARWVDVRRCTSLRLASCFSPQMTHKGYVPMPHEPVCIAIPRTASHNWTIWNGNYQKYAKAVGQATTKNWNWAYGAWLPAYTMTRPTRRRAVHFCTVRTSRRKLATQTQGNRPTNFGVTRSQAERNSLIN